MNIEKNICLNALQMIVNQNDPAFFNSADIFERYLIANGAYKSEELETLKKSLSCRIPWEVRKYSKNLTSATIQELADNFSTKSKTNSELALWAVETWITVLGLKTVDDPVENPISNQATMVNNNRNTLNQANVQNNIKKVDGIAFEQIKGRLGVVFGEDSSGDVKVFNTWYAQSNDEESASFVATPVKIEATPDKPFRTAPKPKKEDKPNKKPIKKISEKPVNNNQEETSKNNSQQQSKTNKTAESSSAIPNNKEQKNNSTNQQSSYVVDDLEQKAYDLLGKGSMFVNEALHILAPIAVKGSVRACRTMGEVYYKGYGVAQNFQAAYAWLKISAAQDDPESLFLVGTMYQFGMGVKRDMVLARQFFERAVALGHSKAADSLKIIKMGL